MDIMRVGVIGDPVAHSLSPIFQQAAFDALAIRARYERWQTAAADLDSRFDTLRAEDYFGANVTVPHKVAAADLVDELAETARRIGAVNTVVNRAGRLTGDNTDVYGFQRALLSVRSGVERDHVLILGAGGAARAVVAALADIGVAGITVANRTVARAHEMIEAVGATGAAVIPMTDWDLMSAIRDHSVIVNATSIGWNDDQAVLAPALMDALDPNGLVADLTYRDTPLLLMARDRGITAMDGLAMLVHQGARSFELWTGKDAPVEIMMAAAEEARNA